MPNPEAHLPAMSPQCLPHSLLNAVEAVVPPGPECLESAWPALFESAPVAMALCTFLEGRWLRCNAAMRQLLGLEKDNWVGKTSVDLGLWENPMDRSKLVRLLNREGHFSVQQTRLRRSCGAVIDALVSGTTLMVGTTRCTLATYTDVTALVQRRDAALSSEALLSRALRGAAAAIWEWDPSTHSYLFVERWEALLGYDPGELPARRESLQFLVHPGDWPTVSAAMDPHFQEQRPYSVDIRLRTKAGVYRWFNLRGQAERGLDGQPLRMSGTIDDITERRLAEAERMRINERLAMATSTVGISTWELFPDGSAVWDAQTYRLYGRDPATAVLPEVIYRESFSATEMARATEWMIATMKSRVFASIELSIVWPDGQIRWLAAKGKAITDADGRVVSLLGVNWDITDQKRAVHALAQYQQELSFLNQKLMEQEKESNQNLAVSLHDRLGQTLVALRLGADTLELLSDKGSALHSQSQRMQGLTERAMQEVRDVLMHLRPPMLDELGLGRALANELEVTPLRSPRTAMALLATPVVMARRWHPNVEYACFMVAREAITNALQHAMARTIDVHLTLDGQGEGLCLEVIDDGLGIVYSHNAHPAPGHLGLVGMRERAQAIGAHLGVHALVPSGTRVSLHWPKS